MFNRCSMVCCVMMLFVVRFFFFLFKQKTAYEMRISDWSSDVCSSDLRMNACAAELVGAVVGPDRFIALEQVLAVDIDCGHLAFEDDRLALVVGQIGRASGRERVCQYV